VSEVAALLLRDDYVTVNTVSDDERPSHEAITQVRCLWVEGWGFVMGVL
jgi:hypothetical protein